MPQKHLVQVNLREKLNFHDFYFQLRGAGYEDLTMIKSGIFYCIKISKKLSKIICFMQNHELLVFYCGHQSKVHRQKWVSTNRQLIVANLIYITLNHTFYTANVLDAETATISCVTFPVALQMHYVQLLAAANF